MKFEKPLGMQLHQVLTELAKRNNVKHIIWYNCSLHPKKNGEWECFICEEKVNFIESLNEIWHHGYAHLREHNLLPFM